VTRRLPVAIAILVVAAVAIFGLYTATSPNAAQKDETTQRRINLFAVVESITTDVGWEQRDGLTTATMRLTLDDGRTLTVPEKTLVDSYETLPFCTDFVTPKSCVLIADMLGQSVVWFALVPADTNDGDTVLTLPGLVDMQENGAEGVLRNDWVISLATPVVRECSETSTTSLRDFINRYPDTASNSFVNLTTDQIDRVRCVTQ
jgi:hypothetical protein